MLEHAKPNGVYSPEELSEMREELDRGAVEGETPEDRETRAEIILRRKSADRSRRAPERKKSPPA